MWCLTGPGGAELAEEERSAACALTLDGVRVTETAEGLLVEAEGQSAHGSTPEKGVNAIGRLLLALKELGWMGTRARLPPSWRMSWGEETGARGWALPCLTRSPGR